MHRAQVRHCLLGPHAARQGLRRRQHLGAAVEFGQAVQRAGHVRRDAVPPGQQVEVGSAFAVNRVVQRRPHRLRQPGVGEHRVHETGKPDFELRLHACLPQRGVGQREQLGVGLHAGHADEFGAHLIELAQAPEFAGLGAQPQPPAVVQPQRKGAGRKVGAHQPPQRGGVLAAQRQHLPPGIDQLEGVVALRMGGVGQFQRGEVHPLVPPGTQQAGQVLAQMFAPFPLGGQHVADSGRQGRRPGAAGGKRFVGRNGRAGGKVGRTHAAHCTGRYEGRASAVYAVRDSAARAGNPGSVG